MLRQVRSDGVTRNAKLQFPKNVCLCRFQLREEYLPCLGDDFVTDHLRATAQRKLSHHLLEKELVVVRLKLERNPPSRKHLLKRHQVQLAHDVVCGGSDEWRYMKLVRLLHEDAMHAHALVVQR